MTDLAWALGGGLTMAVGWLIGFFHGREATLRQVLRETAGQDEGETT